MARVVDLLANPLLLSRDLDFVSSAGVREISAAVRPLGFERTSGRHFVHAKCPFTLEFPPWPLAVGRQLLQEWSERRVAHGVIQIQPA